MQGFDLFRLHLIAFFFYLRIVLVDIVKLFLGEILPETVKGHESRRCVDLTVRVTGCSSASERLAL